MSTIYEDLVSTMNIATETPYLAELRGTDGDGTSHTNNGSVAFSLDGGLLKYKFTPTMDDASFHDPYLDKLLSASDLRLAVRSMGFDEPVHTMLYPNSGNPTEGVVSLKCFGDANADLAFVEIKFKNLPDGWRTVDDEVRVRGFHDQGLVPDENGKISLIRYGQEVNPAIKLEWSDARGGTWTAKLWKIPTEQRDSDHNFRCTIKLDGARLTGEIAQEFLNENLRPFLQFTFAGRADNHIAVGYDAYNRPTWGLQIRDTAVDIPEDLHSHNWFLSKSRRPTAINPQFQAFCELDTKTKRSYQRVIEAYVYSEQVFALVGSSAVAASLSYTALDSLARVITSGYKDSKDWLRPDLRLKQRKHIEDVIKLVAKRELQEHKAFSQASQIVSEIRNNTFHADPNKISPDWNKSRHQWDNTQTMVELLLLNRLGMESIPIRASVPKFFIEGKDMLAEARQSSIAEKLANRVESGGT